MIQTDSGYNLFAEHEKGLHISRTGLTVSEAVELARELRAKGYEVSFDREKEPETLDT